MGDIPDDIAKTCENLLETISDTRKMMDPDQLSASHVSTIPEAEEELKSYKLQNYKLPDPKKYPRLYKYMYDTYKGSPLWILIN
jgi:hypothetical protein